jgi:hypothetical protein
MPVSMPEDGLFSVFLFKYPYISPKEKISHRYCPCMVSDFGPGQVAFIHHKIMFSSTLSYHRDRKIEHVEKKGIQL